MNATKALWRVSAGIIPGVVMPELTKQWALTAAEWEGGSQAGVNLFVSRREAALRYADSVTNPAAVNWVTVEFLWL